MNVHGCALYMTGPLEGDPEDVREAFVAAGSALKELGADVTGPAFICPPMGDGVIPDARTILESAKNDVDQIRAADAVVTLPGTQPACTDLILADAYAVPVVPLERVAPSAARFVQRMLGAMVGLAVATFVAFGTWASLLVVDQEESTLSPQPIVRHHYGRQWPADGHDVAA